MTDFASLGIELDSRPLLDGSRAMDTLGEASVRVEQKVGALNGQMNDTAVIMRRNAEASSVATSAARDFLTPLQREIDLFGLSRAEVERYNASKAGLSAAAQRQAATLGAAIDAMQRDEKAAREVAAAQDAAIKAGERFVANLKDQVAVLGMNTQQLHAYRASQLGVSEAATPLIAKLAEAGAGAHTAGSHVDGLSFATVGARRELLVLAHELSQGNFQKFGGSMMVLGEQTGAAGLLFSAAGVASLGLAAAVGGTAYAMIKGASEQKHMNDALIMTGNYAGVTSDALNGLAHAAVATGGSIGDAKKVVTELAASGKFTGDQIGYISDSVVALEHATGASIEKTIKQFESLAVQATGHSARTSDAVSKATLKLDDEYHFLTLAVYNQIAALEKEGDIKGASAVATGEFARVTKERSEEIIGNLGNVATAWHKIKEEIGKSIDYLGEWGKKSTAASEVTRLQKGLAVPDMIPGVYNATTRNDAIAQYTRDLAIAQAALNKENKLAADQSAATIVQSEAVHAARRVDAMLLGAQKKSLDATTVAMQEYHLELDKIRAGSTMEDADPRLSQKAIADGEAAIRKAHATAAVKGNDDRAKTLQDALVLEQTAFDREKSIYDARQNMLSVYHAKFGSSDDDFYAGRQTARAEYITAEALAFAKESALIQGYKPKNAEEVAASKTKYDELVKQHLKFVDDMRNAGGNDGIEILASAKKLYDDQAKAIATAGDAEIKSLDAAIAKQREHNAEIGKTKEQIELARRARVNAGTAALQIEDDAYRAALGNKDLDDILIGNDRLLYEQRLAYLDRIIAKRKEEAEILSSGAVLEANDKAAVEAAKAWKHTANTIENDLTNAILDGGGHGWKKLVRDMEMGFARMILQPILAPISSGIASLVNPLAAQSGAGGALGAASAGMSAYNSLANIGTTVTGIGTVLGSSTIGAFGSGLSAGFAGTSVAEAAAAYGAAGMSGVAGGLSAGASIGGAASSGMSMLAAIPGWGWAALGAAAIAAYLMNDGPEEHTRLGFTSNNTPGNISINERGNEGKNSAYIDPGVSSAFGTFGVNSSFWMSSSSPTVTSFLDTVAKTDDALASFLTTTEKASVSSYLTGKVSIANMGAEGTDPNANGALDRVFAQRINNILSGVDPALASLVSDFKGTSQQLATEAAGLLQYRSALRDAGEAVFGVKVTLQDLAALKTPTESTSAALIRVTGEFNATNAVAAALGKTAEQAFGTVGLASEGARAQLILAAGGLSALQQNTASFAQNFLSDAERLAPAAKAMSNTFASMGVALPDTREQFKSLVMGLDLTTQQGATTYASLMSVQDAFAQLHPVVAGAADAVRSAADIASERAKMQDQLDQLTMTQTQLLTKQRNAMDAANRPLFDMVQAAQKLAATSSDMAKFRDAAKSLHDGLLTGSLSTLTPEQQYAEQRRQYEQTKAAALGGDVTAQGNVAAALNSFLAVSQKINGGDSQYAQDFAMAQQDSASMAAWASGQVDSAQAQLAAMNTTNSLLTDISQGITNLPAAIAATPAVVMPTPTLNYSTMGTANTEALVTEVKALRAEVAGLRTDQNKQTGSSIVANDQSNQSSADAIVSGVTNAIRSASIRNKFELE